ncbi:transmembrane protein 114 [Bombus vancouverensis nearcticus]|uniref:transmembrane protein 114 n=1 Tax=Bombus vancouverensis nearcticus TaxID=2705178 RepID=UPI0014390E12|nr:transmembrane protein 114 [Bombus vancouverensis nearcticus]XP_033197794.1 transmembrane protein 114 [Bombus vancouverensis nearcticus]XP_033197795.1 transmembrane protein 114 [Bombus vancouverensis nearcticus]XP_033197796.1 transmembrane protein 114 [Bombus vancouverensis nearcticus]
MASRMKALYNQVIFERRILLGCTVLVGLSVCIWSIAIGTDHWFTVEAPDEGGLPLGDPSKGRRLIYKHMGLWRGCVEGTMPQSENSTEMIPYKECKNQDMFPTEKQLKLNPGLNTVVNYSRTQASFAIISLFVMIMGFSFSIYTFRNPRYMFKRLAGGIHFISAACNMVVIQVLLSSNEFESKHVHTTFPKDATRRYGFSLILAWIVFLCNLFAGCAFIVFSRKRKRDKAPTEEIAMADEPTIIGR